MSISGFKCGYLYMLLQSETAKCRYLLISSLISLILIIEVAYLYHPQRYSNLYPCCQLNQLTFLHLQNYQDSLNQITFIFSSMPLGSPLLLIFTLYKYIQYTQSFIDYTVSQVTEMLQI